MLVQNKLGGTKFHLSKSLPCLFVSLATGEVGKKHFSGRYLSKKLWMLHFKKVANPISICTHFPAISVFSMQMWPFLEQLVQLSDSLKVLVSLEGNTLIFFFFPLRWQEIDWPKVHPVQCGALTFSPCTKSSGEL